MKYISEDAVNKGRQPEMDGLKALCIVLMIFLHVFEYILESPSGAFFAVLNFISTVVGAAAFMACMGLGMRYSRHQETMQHIKRGFELLTAGQLFYLVGEAIPDIVEWFFSGDYSSLANALLVLRADILSFAGLAFIFMALLKKLGFTDESVLGIALIMNVLNFIQFHMKLPMPRSFLLRQLVGFFVTNDSEAFFSLFAYFVFVAFGYWLGGVYSRINDKDGLSLRVLMICLPVWILYYALRLKGMIPFMPEFYTLEQYIFNFGPDAVFNCIGVIIILALFWQLQKIMPVYLSRFISFLSSHIIQYYCISHVLIVFGMLLSDYLPDGMAGTLILLLYAAVVIALISLINVVNDRFLHLHLSTLTGKKRIVVFSAIWIITLAIIVYVYPQLTAYATMWNDYLG